MSDCVNCARPLAPAWKFCISCGARIPPAAADIPAAIRSQDSFDSDPGDEPDNDSAAREFRVDVPLAIGIALGIAGIVLIVVMFSVLGGD